MRALSYWFLPHSLLLYIQLQRSRLRPPLQMCSFFTLDEEAVVHVLVMVMTDEDALVHVLVMVMTDEDALVHVLVMVMTSAHVSAKVAFANTAHTETVPCHRNCNRTSRKPNCRTCRTSKTAAFGHQIHNGRMYYSLRFVQAAASST